MNRYIALLALSMLAALGIFLPGVHPLGAEESGSRFHAANTAYSQGDFTTAIAIYEELTAEQGYSPGLLYNLAGSYAQAGLVGKSVLNYERAAKLAPGNADIMGNLSLVRETAGLFATEPQVIDRLAKLLPMHLWLLAGILGLAGLTGLLLAGLWMRLTPRTVITICCLSLAMTLTAALAVIRQQQEWQGWVVVSQTPLNISPFDGAGAAGTLQEGRLVVPGKRHGAFLFVEDDTGRSGWVRQAALEPIIPLATTEENSNQ